MTDNLADLTGQEVAHYRIDRRIGGGAMAGVYQATDQILDTTVALKVLLTGADDLTRRRFRQEARTGSSLVHPHVVRTLQVGQTSAAGIAYIAMELVEGLSLSELLDEHRLLTIADTSNLLEPIARALAYAHDMGIVHRDVKPSNILLRYVEPGTPNSTQLSILDMAVVPLLSDFGISRALDSPELTSAGRTIGTPSYMAPEQCAGSREVDGRADIYSLGTVLYRCVVGRAPYVGTTTQILHAHVYEPLTIPDVVLNELPNSVIGVLKHSLMKEPEGRYQDVDMMAQQLMKTKVAGPVPLIPRDVATVESTVVEPVLPDSDMVELGESLDGFAASTVTVDSLVTTDSDGDDLFDRDQKASVLVTGTETTSAVVTAAASKSVSKPASVPRVPVKPNSPIKLGSTTHARVTRPLSTQPVSRVPRQRNWAGLVIGAVLLLTVLFGGIATVRSLWPGEEAPATTTTATTDGGSDSEPKVENNSAIATAKPATIGDIDSDLNVDDTDPVRDPSVVDLASDDSRDGPAVSVAATSESAEVQSTEDGPVEDDDNGAEVKAAASIAADHWDDVQYFYERRDWTDALDSLILMQRADETYQPEQVDLISANIYMGLAAFEMQEMLQADLSTNNQLISDSIINGSRLATIANFYNSALKLQPDLTAAKSLLEATDKLAESIPDESVSASDDVESQGALSAVDLAIADLQSSYASYSASLALKGNYCSAVEQLTTAVTLDYQTDQIEQLISYVDECPDSAAVLVTVEEQRRAQQLAKTSNTLTVVTISASEESAEEPSETPEAAQAASVPIEATVVSQPPTAVSPTATAPSRATATVVVPTPTARPAAVLDSNFRASLTGSILYSSIDEGKNLIWRLPVEPDSAATILVDSARLPTVHPNGQLVTYHSNLDFKDGIRGYDMGGGLPLPEGNFIQFIYHPEAAQFSPATWSPSGDMMLFVSTVDGDRVPRIYSSRNNSSGDYLYVNYGREPEWHPFEDLIVYKGADETGNRPGLWIMNSSGDNNQRFSDNAGDSRPVWSANGREIIFMSNSRSASWDIFSVDYETRVVTQLTADPGNDGLPTVSPDGKYVAYLSNRSGVWQILVMPISGGQSQVLSPIRGSLPNWLEHSIYWVR